MLRAAERDPPRHGTARTAGPLRTRGAAGVWPRRRRCAPAEDLECGRGGAGVWLRTNCCAPAEEPERSRGGAEAHLRRSWSAPTEETLRARGEPGAHSRKSPSAPAEEPERTRGRPEAHPRRSPSAPTEERCAPAEDAERTRGALPGAAGRGITPPPPAPSSHRGGLTINGAAGAGGGAGRGAASAHQPARNSRREPPSVPGSDPAATQTLKDCFQKGLRAFMCLLLVYFGDKLPRKPLILFRHFLQSRHTSQMLFFRDAVGAFPWLPPLPSTSPLPRAAPTPPVTFGNPLPCSLLWKETGIHYFFLLVIYKLLRAYVVCMDVCGLYGCICFLWMYMFSMDEYVL